GDVLGDRRRVRSDAIGGIGDDQVTGVQSRVLAIYRDRVAGRAVAGRIGDDGVEAVVAVGQIALARRGRRPGGAAVGRNFIGNARSEERRVGTEGGAEWAG